MPAWELTGGADAAPIRSWSAWREITPVPDSPLVRHHTVSSGGLDGVTAEVSPRMT
ncbi:hypothetical protein [Actinoplanes sp. G11-F43]|uniref:hypothetical protein n=1 Tax=Actinoplanes sp. G11-F43 TaxID=3424130 RepID=UPI003D33E1AA